MLFRKVFSNVGEKLSGTRVRAANVPPFPSENPVSGGEAGKGRCPPFNGETHDRFGACSEQEKYIMILLIIAKNPNITAIKSFSILRAAKKRMCIRMLCMFSETWT